MNESKRKLCLGIIVGFFILYLVLVLLFFGNMRVEGVFEGENSKIGVEYKIENFIIIFRYSFFLFLFICFLSGL